MEIWITNDYDAMSKKAAQLLVSFINNNKNLVLGLATGGTPIGTYKELIRMNKMGQVDFSQITTFNLDEYYPISKENSQSYYYFMKNILFDHINIPIENTNIPDGSVKDSQLECERYEKKIKASDGVDVQLLGIGSNGHIGFNEPSHIFSTHTRKTNMMKSTIEDNARFFSHIKEVPTQAITMGIGTIMSSKNILLLASGAAKAQAVKDMILGKVTPQLPASILQLHPSVTIILDKAAAKILI